MKADFSQVLPEPHILDCDWRYTDETVLGIASHLDPSLKILAVGAPSVARYLEESGQDVLLVDRQPFQAVRNHRQIEPGQVAPDFGKRNVGIVDPPWYPDEARRWIAWTAHGLEPYGEMLVSIWPDCTRPTAREEFEELRVWASTWADFKVLDYVPRYDTPLFERVALEAGGHTSSGLSPRYGRLIHLTLNSLPSLINESFSRRSWSRFILNDYQLALCLDEHSGSMSPITPHQMSRGWIWPYVSRRAPGWERIALWSSRNEVALLRRPHEALSILRQAFGSSDPAEFESKLGAYRDLMSWSIPRPPYRRIMEWRHLQ